MVTTLARRHERVVAVDIDEVAIKQLVEYAADEGLDVIGQILDITDDTAVAVGVSDIESRVGPITALVNGAGVLRTGAAVEFSDADWARTFDVNVRAPFVLSREVARHMIPRRAGSVVTVASNAALVARKGMTAYAASKAAANAFTKSLGLELAEYGIRCNVVAPGSTDTPMLRAMLGDSSDAGLVAGSLGGLPEALATTSPASLWGVSPNHSTSPMRWPSCSPTKPLTSPCTRWWSTVARH